MKKTIYTLILFSLLSSSQAQAQALIALVFGKKISNDKLEMGLFVGPQGGILTGTSTLRPAIGLAIGAYTDVKLDKNNHWSFINYFVFKSPMGGVQLPFDQSVYPDLNPDISTNNIDIERRLTYIDISPTLRYHFNVSWSLGLGAMIGFRLKATDTYHDPIKGGDLMYKYTVTDYTNLFNAGIAIDAEYIFMHGKGLRLSARIEQGFINIYKESTGLHSFTNMFNIGVGIPIRAGK